MTIGEGDKAPAITVTASDGTTIDLAALGQPLVLYFYPKDDTSGCTREAQDFTTLAPDSKSGCEGGRGFARCDEEPREVHRQICPRGAARVRRGRPHFRRVWHLGQKSMYGRKYMGMERATYLIGADGRVLREWRKVKVPGHAEEVLKAARERLPSPERSARQRLEDHLPVQHVVVHRADGQALVQAVGAIVERGNAPTAVHVVDRNPCARKNCRRSRRPA